MENVCMHFITCTLHSTASVMVFFSTIIKLIISTYSIFVAFLSLHKSLYHQKLNFTTTVVCDDKIEVPYDEQYYFLNTSHKILTYKFP